MRLPGFFQRGLSYVQSGLIKIGLMKPRAAEKPAAPVPEAPLESIAAGLEIKAPLEVRKPKPAVALDQIAQAQKERDPKVTEIFVKPTKLTSTTAVFKMPEMGGKEIKPGERWLFQVPEEFRGTGIRTAILVHRKDSKYGASVDGKWDKEGAYNLVSARKTGTDQWVTWSDEYGSKKFAEPRSSGDPEHENLHDWLHSVGWQNVDLLSVTNVGQGTNAVANVHELVIEFFPPGKTALVQEEIYSPGTAFVDREKGRSMPSYGGGMGAHLGTERLKAEGMYPKAIEIGGYGGSGKKDVSENTYVDQSGRLHIKLPPGKVLGGFEIAVGDTELDKNRPLEEQRNKDGHYGKLGWAKLYARVQNSNSSGPNARSAYFMDRVNVPPSGVLSGGPNEKGYVTQPGDEIVVESQGHRSWVMGYRVQFMEPPAVQ